MTAARPRRLVPFHRQLAVRLSILIAGAMLLFEPASDTLLEALLSLLGEPDPHEVTVEETTWHSSRLLRNAAYEGPGRWVPRPAAVNNMATLKSENGSAFVYVDEAGEVVVASETLPWDRGQRWHQPLDAQGTLVIPGEVAEQRRYYTVHLEKEGESAGTLISILVDEPLHAEVSGTTLEEMFSDRRCRYSDDPVVLTEAQWMAMRERRADIQRLVSWVVPIAMALLVSAIVSRLFTRRLRRLAAMSTAVIPGEEDLPGPFDDAGKDEIAGLGRALNTFRQRVGELLEGLAERDSQRREWIAQVSHDLRTPLTALTACLDRADQALREGADDDLRQRMAELVGVARLDADRVNTLADDLLDIARLDADEAPELEPVPPGELVRHAARTLQPLAELRDIAVDVLLDQGLPTLHADGRRLLRALENLLRNALQFASSRVELSARREDGALVLELRDDGPGFPAEDGRVDLGHLAGRRSRQDSAGLGLLVARKMAEAHGGRLEVSNRPEGGGLARIVLPVSAPPGDATELD